MLTLYNRIQGRNLNRLAALSDGIFAVAMTLLVFDLHLPTVAQVHGERELMAALMSFGELVRKLRNERVHGAR